MSGFTTALAPPGFSCWTALHALLTAAFAGMEERIDPPSSLRRMDPGALAAKARDGILVLACSGDDLIGCGFGQIADGSLGLSKLAVRPDWQRRGVLRRMVGVFEAEARQARCTALTLQTRIELTGNHAAFAALGFRRVGETSHPGYDRPTSLTFRKAL